MGFERLFNPQYVEFIKSEQFRPWSANTLSIAVGGESLLRRQISSFVVYWNSRGGRSQIGGGGSGGDGGGEATGASRLNGTSQHGNAADLP